MNQELIRENVSLAPFTYYKIGGSAQYFAQPTNLEELKTISLFLKNNKIKYLILGAGSNVLISDEGFQGLVIQTSKLDKTLTQNQNRIEVGAGVMVIQLLRHCMSTGLAGFELLVGIPGNMGGVLFMNAGTKLGEIKDIIEELTVFDLESQQTRTISRSEMKYSYRHQDFIKPSEIILKGTLVGRVSDPKSVQAEVQNLLTIRKNSQPIDKPSCGSVFKNPDPKNGLFAWKLIEQAGLRGKTIGNAQVSNLHTNFIVNLGGAKASDVLALIELIKKEVHSRFNITLQEEVRIIKK